jgi:hypothetical protein
MRSALMVAVALLAVAFGPTPQPISSAEPAPMKGLAVHEWGVVSVYSDVELANADMRDEWAGLPKFVYGQVDGRLQPERFLAVKAPVLYFHAPQPLTATVRVEFPGGKPAVWWPANSNSLPNGLNAQPLTLLQWNAQVRASNANNFKHTTLPKGHWMEALRDVKADDVLVFDDNRGGAQLERFIYYDGLIPAPKGLAIQVKGDTISLKSQAKHALLDVTVVDLRSLRKIRTGSIARLDAGGEVAEVKLVERDQSKWPYDGIAELVGQLTTAGLNEDEAKALVAVWRKAFFETEGVGVFYRLPQEIYDQVLPLTVNPKPEKTVRTLLIHHPHCEPDLRERVLALVTTLGSEKFQERIDAQERLTALGKAAFIHLLRACDEAKDPEVKARLIKVLEAFEAEKAFK